MSTRRMIFTSESVNEGHPDKVCDRISDAVLDLLIGQDPMSRVACETAVTTDYVLIMGEVTCKAYNPEKPEDMRRFKADVENAPDDWRAWYRLGIVYDAAGDRRRARAAVRTAIRLERGRGVQN